MELLKKPQPSIVIDYDDWLAIDAPQVEAVKAIASVDIAQLLNLITRTDEIQIEFSAFADGRGFSIARILRRAGYGGVIRAVGDVAVDRVAYMQRVGFDAIELKDGEEATLLPRLLGHVKVKYQLSSDGLGPVYA